MNEELENKKDYVLVMKGIKGLKVGINKYTKEEAEKRQKEVKKVGLDMEIRAYEDITK